MYLYFISTYALDLLFSILKLYINNILMKENVNSCPKTKHLCLNQFESITWPQKRSSKWRSTCIFQNENVYPCVEIQMHYLCQNIWSCLIYRFSLYDWIIWSVIKSVCIWWNHYHVFHTLLRRFTPASNIIGLCFYNPGQSIPVINPFILLWHILHFNDFMKQINK